jgi:hypothetical protein
VLLIYMRYIEKISMDNSTAANASGVEAYSWGAFRSGMANLTLSSRQSSRLSSSRGSGGMPSFLRSNKQPSDSGSSSGVDDSAKSPRGGASNSEHRFAGNGTRSKKMHLNLPVATSLDIPLNFDTKYGNADNGRNPIPTADATFPSVMFSTGVFDRG